MQCQVYRTYSAVVSVFCAVVGFEREQFLVVVRSAVYMCACGKSEMNLCSHWCNCLDFVHLWSKIVDDSVKTNWKYFNLWIIRIELFVCVDRDTESSAVRLSFIASSIYHLQSKIVVALVGYLSTQNHIFFFSFWFLSFILISCLVALLNSRTHTHTHAFDRKKCFVRRNDIFASKSDSFIRRIYFSWSLVVAMPLMLCACTRAYVCQWQSRSRAPNVLIAYIRAHK